MSGIPYQPTKEEVTLAQEQHNATQAAIAKGTPVIEPRPYRGIDEARLLAKEEADAAKAAAAPANPNAGEPYPTNVEPFPYPYRTPAAPGDPAYPYRAYPSSGNPDRTYMGAAKANQSLAEAQAAAAARKVK